MNNMVTYAQSTMDTFGQRPVGSVDSLIFSWVSYMHFPEGIEGLRTWEGVRLQELLRAECFEEMFADLWDPQGNKELMFALAASPRFRDVRLCGYVERLDKEKEEQFAAVTFKIAPDLSYIAFRGTDATLVGWKEDFNMAFQCPVPSQEAAVCYLKAATEKCPGRILVGGHSKGGNLSVYSAVKCGPDVQKRIQRIYSHDGPGFQKHILESEDFLRIRPKVEKTLPQSSLVGMLLENQEDFLVVKSSSVSLLQHDPFSWIVREGQFDILSDLTAGAKFRDVTLNEWIYQLPREERERFVDALFEVIGANDIEKVAEFGEEWQKNIPAAFRKVSQMDAQTRNILFDALRKLASLSIRNFGGMIKGARETER